MKRSSVVFIVSLLVLLISTWCFAQRERVRQGNNDKFISAHFSGPGVCAPCHDGITDLDGNDVSLVQDWSRSLMAFSFIDPLWQAKVETEVLRNPGLQELIEEKCAKCHAPMAVTESLFEGVQIKLLDNGFFDPDNPYHALARGGVGCTLCHQIEDNPDLGTDDGISGHFTIGDYLNPDDRPLFGQYGSPFARTMLRSVNFDPKYSVHMHEAEICATCHDLKTPYVDSTGQVVEGQEFPEQMPYAEWLESIYSQPANLTTCQQCHALQTEAAPLSRSPGWLQARENFSRHTFFTENTMLLEILDRYSDELGVSGDLQAMADEGRAYLNEAGSIIITDAHIDVENTLRVEVEVTNDTGHKLPTSIPIRRVFIHLRVLDEAGAVIFESGKPLVDGSIEGVDADADGGQLSYEEHYTTIDNENQVQVYEGIMGNTDGMVTYTLLRAAYFIKDNRIPPKGFNKENVHNDVRPAGNCMTDDDFNDGGDQVTYMIKNISGESYTVEATLYDQTLGYRFAMDLFEDEGSPLVDRYKEMYDAVGNGFEEIDSTSLVVTNERR